MNEEDEFDKMCARAPRVEANYTTEVDKRFFIQRKKKDDPIKIISCLGITDDIKKEAIKYYTKYLATLDIAEKDTQGVIFWAVYAASRKLKIPVTVDIIARIAGLGMEKYEPDVRRNPLDYGVKLNHKRLTDTLTAFSTILKGTEAEVNMTPCCLREFIEFLIDEQELQDHEDYINSFLDTLEEDEFWSDQNPNMLGYAILFFLAGQVTCPFKGHNVEMPIFYSKNIVVELINKLKSSVFVTPSSVIFEEEKEIEDEDEIEEDEE